MAESVNSVSRLQRVLLKGFTYKDVIVEVTDDGLHLTSEARPKYLDRLIPWISITHIESQRLEKADYLKEYWHWLMKLQEYSGLLPYYKYKNMVALTFDDKTMMEKNVHITLNVDDETYNNIKTGLADGVARAEHGSSDQQRFA